MLLAKRWMLGLIVLLLSILRGFGQTPPRLGSIEGTVIDQSGKPVAGAAVEARLDRNPRRTDLFTTSDSAGKFTLRDIPSGDALLYAHKESEGYPDQFFAFFKTDNISTVLVKVEAGQASKSVTLRLGEKAAYLNIEMTNENGSGVAGQVTFTRDDQPGHYQQGTNGEETIMVPPVPFRLTVEAAGYEPWHYGGENWQGKGGLVTLKSGESLNLDIRLKRAR